MAEKHLTIEAGKGELHYWQDFWRFRELFLFLSWRDVKVRYKQTVIGIVWVLLQPLLTMLIFTIVFGRIAKFTSENNAPYPIMVFAAILPWKLFANALANSSNSVISSANLISKIYFPRVIVPLSSIVTALVDFLVSFVILLGLMLYYRFPPSPNLLFLPIFLFLNLLIAAGIGLIVSALNVQFRDFRYIIPFAIQMGLYISPVGFSSTVIPEKWRFLYSLNPMVGVIDGFRWCILGHEGILYVPGLVVSLLLSMLLLVVGVKVFRSMERTFADKI